MGIAKMNKLYLVAHQAEKDKVLAILQQLGVLEVSDLQAKDVEGQAWAEMVEGDQEQEALQSLEARLADVRFSLDFLQRYYPAKKSLLAALNDSKMVVNSAELSGSAAEWDKVSSNVYVALRKTDEKLMLLRNEETRLQNLKIQLTPWVKLDVPLEEIKATPLVRTELGTLPAAELAHGAEQIVGVDINPARRAAVATTRPGSWRARTWPATRCTPCRGTTIRGCCRTSWRSTTPAGSPARPPRPAPMSPRRAIASRTPPAP